MPSKNATVTGGAQATIDHDEIREWVEQHGGHPAAVKRTRRGKTPGILRIDFPGLGGEDSLEPISWEEFFARFEESQLAFLHQDRTKTGRPSRFNKLVARDTVEIAPTRRRKAAAKSRVPAKRPLPGARKAASTDQKAAARTSQGRSARSKVTTGTGALAARSRGATRRAPGSPRPTSAANKARSSTRKATTRMEQEAPSSRRRQPTTKKRATKKRATKKRVPNRGAPSKRSRSSAQ